MNKEFQLVNPTEADLERYNRWVEKQNKKCRDENLPLTSKENLEIYIYRQKVKKAERKLF